MGRLSPQGDRLDREAGHGCARYAHSVFGRSISPRFFRRENPNKAPPARHDKRAAERWLFDK